MADCFAHEFGVCVGEDGDAANGVDSVDVGDDALESQVPVGVEEGGDVHGEEGHVPRGDFGRWW